MEDGHGHKERGFQMIYLGPVPWEETVSMYGHLVLRTDDKTVVRARSVLIHKGVYPWKPVPERALPPGA